MTIVASLTERAGSKCELCGAGKGLSHFDVQPNGGATVDNGVLICETCLVLVNSSDLTNTRHWSCLRESMWSEHTPVKVLVYRILKRISADPLSQELLGQIYLEPEVQAWADAGGEAASDGDETTSTRDSNGTVLQEGDTVTLIKDLDVKGANFIAKRGITVKGINLTDDPKYVEGRVNGIRIVLVSAYLKKV